jgi:hypothetical protein
MNEFNSPKIEFEIDITTRARHLSYKIYKCQALISQNDKSTPIPRPLPKWEGEYNSLLSPLGERRVGDERGHSLEGKR